MRRSCPPLPLGFDGRMSGELRKPTELIAKKKERLFSDDFERAELGKDKGWAIVVPRMPSRTAR